MKIRKIRGSESGETRTAGKTRHNISDINGIINAAEFWGKQGRMGKDIIQVTKTGIKTWLRLGN